MPSTDTLDIKQLTPDNHNFNKGTTKGKKMMGESFRRNGAGRSILLDKNNRIIAGNKSQQAAIDAGITKVRIIETTGDELVAVKRTDVDLDSAQGREMALADNVTSEENISWDKVELELMQAEYDLDFESVGIDIGDPPDLSDKVGDFYQIVIDCQDETEQQEIYNKLKDRYPCQNLTL